MNSLCSSIEFNMASLRLPVPSVGLLRFLRSQSEGLSFFNPNNAPAPGIRQAARQAWCAAKRRAIECSRPDQVMDCQRSASLKSGMFDLDSFLQSRSRRASLSSRARTGIRYSSSGQQPPTCKSTWKERFWGPGAKKGAKPLEPDDLPTGDGDGENNSMFNTPRQLSQKAALEPRLRCTEVDENGKVILMDGEFKKSELIARVGFDLDTEEFGKRVTIS